MTFATKQKLSPIKRVIIQVPIIIVLLSLALICFRWSLADVYATQVKFILEREDVSDSKENVLAWNQAEQHLKNMLSLRPKNPQYFELAENFYQTLYALEESAPTLLKKLGWKKNEEIALQYARQALVLRPSWPYLWEELALSKTSLEQFDKEQTGAIERAITLGPWQQSIHYTMAMVGLDDWENQSDEAKKSILKAMDQSMVMNQINPYRKKLELMITHNSASITCIYYKTLHLINLSTLEKFCLEKLLVQ